jgi:acyl-CoA reductase-like NAD-dependent aldehyde dehydrogenase
MTTIHAGRWQELVGDKPDLSKLFIDGAYVDAASGETVANISPVDGQVLNHIAEGGVEDVDRAVAAARRAFDDGRWSELSPRDRKGILLRFADLLRAHTGELGALMTADMGKPIGSAEAEVGYSANTIQWMAEAIDHLYGEVAPLDPDRLGFITREPVGVVAAVVPWNYPLLMPVWKMGPALASGNTMVVKPAEQAPLVVIRIAELAGEAGIPDGVYNVVPGRGEVAGRALAEHMDVDAITFTGSTAVGRLVMGYAATSNLKKVSLELGGKSPNIVLADAGNIEAVAASAAAGIFGNSGQMCDAGSRLVVHRSIADEVVAAISEQARSWRPGDPFDRGTSMGSVVDRAQMEQVLAYIESGRSAGAAVPTGGTRALEETGGYYVEPTVLAGVSNEMAVAREEIFGPVLSVLTFADEEEALRIAHDTEYGLAAGVWTRDITKAHRIAKRLRAGSVWINSYDNGDITLPHGGFKQSGFGRDKSLHAFDNYTQQKVTVVDLTH